MSREVTQYKPQPLLGNSSLPLHVHSQNTAAVDDPIAVVPSILQNLFSRVDFSRILKAITTPTEPKKAPSRPKPDPKPTAPANTQGVEPTTKEVIAKIGGKDVTNKTGCR